MNRPNGNLARVERMGSLASERDRYLAQEERDLMRGVREHFTSANCCVDDYPSFDESHRGEPEL